MLIATRVLKLHESGGEREIPVRIFAPEQSGRDWGCRSIIGWPDGEQEMTLYGIDGAQALVHTLQMIGARLYTSDYHESGALYWDEPGQGYGFPVMANIRDLLIGSDKKFF